MKNLVWWVLLFLLTYIEFTYKLPFSLMFFLRFFNKLGSLLKFGIHKLLLQLFMFEHFINMLKEKRKLYLSNINSSPVN